MTRHGIDFAVLDAVPQSDAIASYPLPDRKTQWGPILLAHDNHGQRRVLVAIEDGAPVKSDRESAGIHVGRAIYTVSERQRTFLEVRCLLPQLHDLFSLIAEEIIDTIVGNPDVRPDETARTVLARWRQLLAASRRDVPSIDALQGLWGELWHLKQMCALDERLLECWVGWDSSAHDFKNPRVDIEVKTIRSRSWKVRISNIDQLDSGAGSLLLSVVKVERAGPDGQSVFDLIDEIMDIAPDHAGLLTALDKFGLSLDHRFDPDASSLRLSISDHRAWWVEGDFPRVIRTSFETDDLPGGVVSVEYALQLSERVTEAITDDEFQDALRGRRS